MQEPSFPDFFIVGAPRCGTTSLSKYLRQHPRICFSSPKETHYFTSHPPGTALADLRHDYVERFFPEHRPGDHQAMGEGTPTYLYAPEAIELIRSIEPRAKFIAMVRNPMELLPSYHRRMLYIFEEEVADFSTAFALQASRARGEALPKLCADPRLLQYTEIGLLGKHVARLFEQVGRQNCHVVVYDDLADDPRAVYDRVLKFLGVEHHELVEFPRHLPTKGYRSPLLHRLMYKPPSPLVASLDPRKAPKSSWIEPIKQARKKLIRWNRLEVSPAPLEPRMRDTLRATFSEDIAALGRLLGRDLVHWT